MQGLHTLPQGQTNDAAGQRHQDDRFVSLFFCARFHQTRRIWTKKTAATDFGGEAMAAGWPGHQSESPGCQHHHGLTRRASCGHQGNTQMRDRAICKARSSA